MDFHNSSGIRSPFSPRVRQSAVDKRPKNTQGKFVHGGGEQKGEVIYKSPHMTVETYGAPLPVTVTEALTFGGVPPSVRMSDIGWCWVVVGRRVLCSVVGAAGAVRDLVLPQTDLAHRAELVLLCGDQQMPSCIGVSPEGMIRYWPSIAQEAAFVETSCDLQGQECLRLCAGPDADWLLLSTTSGALLRVWCGARQGRHQVQAAGLRAPGQARGTLAGLGRRVSQLFFQPAQPDTRLVGAVVLGALVGLVGRGAVLQLWGCVPAQEHDLRRLLPGELGGAELECVYVRESGPSSLLLLLAAPATDHHSRYVLAEFCVSPPAAPRVTWLSSCAFRPRGEVRALSLGGAAVLHSHSGLARVYGTTPNEKVEILDVGSEGDRILGAEIVNGSVLLFSAKHGITRLVIHTQNSSACESPLESPSLSDMYDGNLSFYEVDPQQVDLVTTDAFGKLKTAFLYHIRRDPVSCQRVLGELFASGGEHHNEHLFHTTVLTVARDILDDIPAGDPRWKQPAGAGVSLGSSGALQVGDQLADKTRALSLLHRFVRREAAHYTTESTMSLLERELCTLAERLAAASCLASLRAGSGVLAEVLDSSICEVVSSSEEEWSVERALSGGVLSPADVVFRRVSGIWRLLAHLPLRRDPTSALAVFTSVLGAVSKCRAAWGGGDGAGEGGERPGWAGERGPGGLRDTALAMHKEFFTSALPQLSGSARALGLHHAELLTRHVLADSLHEEDYRQLCRDLIQPFVECSEVSRACQLAEEAREFPLLVELCVTAGGTDTLLHYVQKYPQEELARLACVRLAARPGPAWARLVALAGPLAGPLDAWAPSAPRPLGVLLRLQRGARAEAAELLKEMAETEGDVGRLLTAASLGKLCALSVSRPELGLVSALDRRLALAEQHRRVPPPVRERALRYVHEPEELLQLYLSGEADLDEYDYLRALDIATYIQDEDRRDDVTLQIWVESILCDDWSECRADSPELELQQKMFFRLLERARLVELESVLPPLEDVMTCPRLADTLTDAASYLISYGYRRVQGDR